MSSLQEKNELARQFPGNSELAKRMRSLDWSATDFSSPNEWPNNLRVSVKLCLTSKIPIVIYWGPKFSMLYNDAYISFLGKSKHPFYLGKSCRDCWPEIWETIGPMLTRVYNSGEATWSKDIRMLFARNLPLEEVYVRFSFGPILADDGCSVQGIFCPCTETTEQIIGARRLETLRRLGTCLAEAPHVVRVCEQSVEVIAKNPDDLPFAAVYILDETTTLLNLIATTGLPDVSVIPKSVAVLQQEIKSSAFISTLSNHHLHSQLLALVLQTKQPEIIADFSPQGPGLAHCNQAIILPIPSTSQEGAGATGILLLGISPRCVLDDAYLSFFNLIAKHIGTVISNAKAYEAECKHVELFTERDRAKTNLFSRLQALATRFVQEEDVPIILSEIVDAAISIANANKGNIQLIDEAEGSIKIVASRGFSQPYLDHFANCADGEGAWGAAFLSGDSVIIEDVTQSAIFVGTPNLAPLLAEGVRAVQSIPLKDQSGKIVGILSTYYLMPYIPHDRDLQMMDLLARLSADIIERGRWLQERAKIVEKMQEIDRKKDDFLAILSHELRNPLAAISNSIFMLSYAAPGGNMAQRAQATIHRQVKQITRLVDDLLDITRITQGKIQLQFQKVDVNKIVHRTVEDHRAIFESLAISLQEKLPRTPVFIKADSARVAQVVGNLLQNAAKFSLTGGITEVSVSIERKTAQATIRVTDNGVGIEPKLLKHIFEPFMQAERTLERNKGGLGLGLSLVKKLVELHGGSINASSLGVGQGAEFIIKFPLDETATENKIVEFTPRKTAQKISQCILIIEDNIAAAESLRDVLEVFGHRVYVSHNEYDGIEKALKIKPNLVLCDIGLPGIDGYEIARIFKADENLSSICLIALSGYAGFEDIEKAYAAGFDHHLVKPPNLNLLQQLLAQNVQE